MPKPSKDVARYCIAPAVEPCQAHDAIGSKRAAFKDLEKLKEVNESLVNTKDFNRCRLLVLSLI